MSDLTQIECLGIGMHPLTMRATVDHIEKRICDRSFTQHVVVNVAKLVHAQSDEILRSSIQACHISNIDGMGLLWGVRLLGFNAPERVAGVDLFLQLVALGANRGFPIFLLGAHEDIVAETARRLAHSFPGIRIAGYHHGYFWDDEQSVVEAIRSSGARLLFVAITSPKKENFINRWQDQLGVDFVMGVGGSFDVVAGKVKRAPAWMQRSGLEWLYRVIQEPKRMWKRYAVTNSVFAWMVLRGLISRKFRKHGYTRP